MVRGQVTSSYRWFDIYTVFKFTVCCV